MSSYVCNDEISLYVNDIEKNSLSIIDGWMGSDILVEILKRKHIDIKLFRDTYAKGVLNYFIGILKSENQLGDCPVMHKMLKMFSDHNINSQEVFLICAQFKRAFINFLFEANIASQNIVDNLNFMLDENFAGVISTYDDIIKKHERELKIEKKRLHEYTNAIDASMIVSKTDTEGRITYINKKFIEVSGYSEKELIGKTHAVVRHENTPDALYKEMWNTITLKKTWNGMYKNKKKNSQEYYVDAAIIPILDHNDNLSEYISLQYDVTNLMEVTQQAKAADVAKSNFLAAMSHELRTPLTGILGFMEKLEKGEQNRDRKEQFHTIRNSGETLLSIINDILDFSKIENGKLGIELFPVNLRYLLNNSFDTFGQLASAKNINLLRVVNDNLPDCIHADEIRLKQVVFNLMSNAVKFTNNGGNITLQARYLEKQKLLHISVLDTGVGISKDNMQKIFQAFTQEDISTTRKFGGTGLGLSISSQLISLMGGELKVKSELGKGSEFYFEIPVEVCNAEFEENQKSFITPDEDTNEMSFTGHALIVEDNKTNQMLMSMILDDLGLTYDIANDGAEGVLKYKLNKYDVILMDENMPVMNGIEATKLIREQEQDTHIPIIAVTANALVEDRERFLEAGMDDYISKPYTEEDIVRALRKYIL